MTRARILVLVVVLAGTACSGPVRMVAPPRPVPTTAAEVIDRLPTPDSLWTTFRIRAQLAFSTPEGRGSFSAEIHVRRADSILVHLRVPLGIEGARVLVTRDSVEFFDRMAGVVYVGDRSSGLLPAGLHADDLAAAFFGFDRPERTGWRLEPDSTRLHLERVDGTSTLLIDPTWWRIALRELRDLDGTLIESRRFTEFESFDGVVLPRRITTMRPEEDSRASFVVRSVESEPSTTSHRLDVPNDIRRIRIR